MSLDPLSQTKEVPAARDFLFLSPLDRRATGLRLARRSILAFWLYTTPFLILALLVSTEDTYLSRNFFITLVALFGSCHHLLILQTIRRESLKARPNAPEEDAFTGKNFLFMMIMAIFYFEPPGAYMIGFILAESFPYPVYFLIFLNLCIFIFWRFRVRPWIGWELWAETQPPTQ